VLLIAENGGKPTICYIIKWIALWTTGRSCIWGL